jgi:uncharacterized protein
MAWLKLFEPDIIVPGTILDLDARNLRDRGILGLLVDIDDTLIPPHIVELSSEVKDWVDSAKAQMPIWLVSNNPGKQRIHRIAEDLELPYLLSAGKPSRRKLFQATAAMNLPVNQVAMVGDRLFTDVLAGNRAGTVTIWVEPIVYSNQSPGFHGLRDIEVAICRGLGVALP